MSRVGNLPIPVPAGVSIDVGASSITVKGPKGQLEQARVPWIEAEVGAENMVFTRKSESKQARANHGLLRALVANMVHGVTQGFTKQLDVIGIGYRADVKGKNLVLQLGYSHPIEFPIPADVGIEVDKKNRITITGIDKQRVGQVAAVIRGFREPDHYKGKGVRYVNEYVRLKAGKTA